MYSLRQIEEAGARLGRAEDVVVCPRCGAPKGDDCHTRTWRKAAYVHAARLHKWGELIAVEIENPGRSTPPQRPSSLEAPRGTWQSDCHGAMATGLVV